MVSMTTLYHGSHEPLTHIDPELGLFGGVFCSESRTVARSHGATVSAFEVDDSEIASSRDLHDGWIVAVDTVRAMPRYNGLTEEQIEVLADAACSGEHCEFAVSHEGAGEGYRGWEMQRVRGAIARALGFAAVEMDDEHGTSYLLLTLYTLFPSVKR